MTEQSIYQHLRDFVDHFEPELPISPHMEISEGQIVMMMSPSGAHDANASRITRQLIPQLADDLEIGGFDIEHPLAAKMRRPDVAIVEEEATHVAEAVDATAIRLAIEIVSPSNPENDYIGKVRDYPLMGVPQYLIVDPRDGTCLHYSNSDGTAYRDSQPYTFGETVPLGEWTLDTSQLLRYPARKDQGAHQ